MRITLSRKGQSLNILVACEFSGRIREAFKAKGHNAWSCDLLPSETEGQHIQGDVLKFLEGGWDMMVAFPPCTYLTTAGNIWFTPRYKDRFPERLSQRQDAISFFMTLVNARIPRIAIENPVSVMSTEYRKPDQIINPFQFGDPTAKRTCLWLKNLPKLISTHIVEPEYQVFKNGKRQGVGYFLATRLDAEERMKARSRTFNGVALAMADQWNIDPLQNVPALVYLPHQIEQEAA